MINRKSGFVPKYTANNVKELVAAPFQNIAAGIQAQQADEAAARKAQRASRNSQLNKLYNVSGKGFEGWALQHIDEYEKQFKQSLEKVKSAQTQEEADQYYANELLRLDRLHSRGEQHARVMVSQNSAHDQYIGWKDGTKKWDDDSTVPLTSEVDLERREDNLENSSINVEYTNVGGYETAVGDYVSPNGRVYSDEIRERYAEAGYNVIEQTDESGVTYLVPVNEQGQPVADPEPVRGPLFLHPKLGNRDFFTPDTAPNFVAPIDFLGLSSIQKAIDELQKGVDTDNPAQRISEEKANEILRTNIATLFNSQETIKASAITLYKEEYGIDYDPADFKVDEESGKSVAEVEGYKTPKDLYIDKVMEPVKFKRNLPQGSSGGSGTRKILWANVDKANKKGLPEVINYSEEEQFYLGSYTKEEQEILKSIQNAPRIDLTVPEEISLQFKGEKVNTIRMYREDDGGGYILVERVNADTQGEMKSSAFDRTDPKYWDRDNSAWNWGWNKQPEPEFFIIPIMGDDFDFSDPFKALEENIKSEYQRAGDMEGAEKPLREIYFQGI